MKIKRIELKNVKCFSEKIIELTKEGTGEPLSVCAFVGANGAGKSAILKSIVALFSTIVDEYQGELFSDDAIYNQGDELSVKLVVELNEDEKLLVDYEMDEFPLIYRHCAYLDEYGECDHLLVPEEIQEGEREKYVEVLMALLLGESATVLMYYDPYRFISEKNPAGPNFQQDTSAKRGALLSNLDKSGENKYRDLEVKQWIVNMDYLRLKEPTHRNLSIYDHVVKAFELLMSPLTFEEIHQNGSLIFRTGEDNQQVTIDMLSDGFKSIFSIVLDIMRRMALAPDTDGEEFYMKESIVLIDEIDCHIHPKWQRELIPALKELFPNCQFIFTTHSPYILDGLQEYEIKKVGERNII